MDISVSCDGTWARRGFQSLYGMISAIHMETGKAVDYEVKGKVFYKCRAKKILIQPLRSTFSGKNIMAREPCPKVRSKL